MNEPKQILDNKNLSKIKNINQYSSIWDFGSADHMLYIYRTDPKILKYLRFIESNQSNIYTPHIKNHIIHLENGYRSILVEKLPPLDITSANFKLLSGAMSFILLQYLKDLKTDNSVIEQINSNPVYLRIKKAFKTDDAFIQFFNRMISQDSDMISFYNSNKDNINIDTDDMLVKDNHIIILSSRG